MSIKIKARQTLMTVGDHTGEYLYVMSAENYNRLDEEKVFAEAHEKSGLSVSVLKGAWNIVGEVIKTWATEGHIVPLPGFGSIRFGVRANAVADVKDVKASLIKSRRIIFVPSGDIKQELGNASISITCYDKEGKVVKRVDSGDSGDVEDPDTDPDTDGQ